MKIKTKVRAGRACGGGDIFIWINHRPQELRPQELTMKIKTKVRAGRDCGDSFIWNQSRTQELTMKIKTKVRAGRDCGIDVFIWPGVATDEDRLAPVTLRGSSHPPKTQELTMKIKTKVRAGRDCGGGVGDIFIWPGIVARRGSSRAGHAAWFVSFTQDPGAHHEDQDQGSRRP